MIGFWRWFFRGDGKNKPGAFRYLDRWLFLHCLIGILISLTLPISLQEAGTSLLLPIASIFVGLSFAWGGNAQALLQTSEIEEVVQYKEGGYEDYVYAFQSAILMILITLTIWGAAGLGIFDKVWPACRDSISYKFISFFLFTMASITLRECWHVVLGAQTLLLMRFKVKQSKK